MTGTRKVRNGASEWGKVKLILSPAMQRSPREDTAVSLKRAPLQSTWVVHTAGGQAHNPHACCCLWARAMLWKAGRTWRGQELESCIWLWTELDTQCPKTLTTCPTYKWTDQGGFLSTKMTGGPGAGKPQLDDPAAGMRGRKILRLILWDAPILLPICSFPTKSP